MRLRAALPGLLLASALVGAAMLVPGPASPLAIALPAGVLIANARPLPAAVRPGLHVAAGFAICGTSAVSAVAPFTDARREEVAYAVGLVTLCGALSVALLPLLQGPAGRPGQ